MCGIIGIIGSGEPAAGRLLSGLERLAYRGYDSAGIATLEGGAIHRRRAQGKIAALGAKLATDSPPGTTGIGHTRWATHGRPTEANAHPHASPRVAVVHNGIIENYAALKAGLQADGAVFESETDTEVIVHLVTAELAAGRAPRQAAFAALDRLQGAYAVAILFADDAAPLIGARQGTPLAVGWGRGEMFVASDSYALAPLTSRVTFLEDGDRVVVTPTSATIFDRDGAVVERPVRISTVTAAQIGKGDHKHFMHKEIHEQPAVLGELVNSLLDPATGASRIEAGVLETLRATPRLTMAACGTAAYATRIAQHWFEQVAGVPCAVDIASEFRYRTPPLPEGGAALFVSQSGETLDTLEALRYCKAQGQRVVSVLNTIESTMERESDHVLRTQAGPEIGVASTKATAAQLTVLAATALSLAQRDVSAEAQALRHVPALMIDLLKREGEIAALAHAVSKFDHLLYIGRGIFYPLACEGAHKLKEVSYIHAEAYAGGEPKHGAIALIDENFPTIAIAPSNDPLFEKMVSNIKELAARGGKILLLSDAAGARAVGQTATWSLAMPEVHPFAAPILYLLPLQLLAYHGALAKGTDADQPRNLAKSVTVE